jgi:predicted Fe-Mo cluster-binding NifX family protein
LPCFKDVILLPQGGTKRMKIAISTDGKNVSEHFGRCPHFTIAEIEQGSVRSMEVIDNPGHSPGFIPRFLYEKGINCIICGGMGARASRFFDELGISAITGVCGTIDSVLQQYAEGILEGGPSSCTPGGGKGYGIEKEECDHDEH